MNNPRRFIEESFPVKEVGAALAKEKRIRHGHIRPLDLFVSQKKFVTESSCQLIELIMKKRPKKTGVPEGFIRSSFFLF